MKRQEPSEDVDSMWRTTDTHSKESMMKVFRELYFADFPAMTDVTQGNERRLPDAFVKEYFGRFGKILNLEFDGARGIGCVTFETGEIAETAYMATHLSVLPNTMSGGSDNYSSSSSSAHNLRKGHILYIEFAQILPFVNPLLLEEDKVSGSVVNRQLLRTFPVKERHYNPKSGSSICWGGASGKKAGTTRENFLPGGATDLSVCVAEVLGFTAGGGPEGSEDGGPNASNNNKEVVTMMDLWYAYFTRFVVGRGQLRRKGIPSPFLKFSGKKCFYEEIRDSLENDEALARRLFQDDALHCAAAFLCLKLRVKNDPSLCTFFGHVLREADISPSSRTFSHAVALADKQEEEEFFKIPFITLASNLVANAKLEVSDRLLGTGHNDPTRNKNNKSIPAAIQKQLDDPDVLFSQLIDMVEQSAGSGSAASLYCVCCPPEMYLEAKRSGPTFLRVIADSVKWPLLIVVAFLLCMAALIRYIQ